MTFGQKLRQAREARGFELEAVAAETKIGRRYLQALEADDFSALPGDVFVKGYVRAIGKCIGVDSEPLVAAFVKQRESAVSPPAEGEADPVVREMSRVLQSAPRSAAARPGRGPLLPVAFAAAGVIAVLTVAWVVADLLRPRELKPLRTQQVVPDLGDALDLAPEQGSATEPVVEPPAPATRTEPEPVQSAPLTQAPASPAPVKPAPPPPSTTKTTARAQLPPAPKPATTTAKKREQAPPPPSRTTKPAAPPPTEIASAKPTPPPAPPPAPPKNPLVVADHGIGADVSASGLVGQAEVFHEGGDVWFWTRVQRGQAGDSIRHVWIHEGREVASFPLEIGSGDWRTQSRFSLDAGSQGGWSVEARDASGRVLARSAFVCVSP